MKRSVIAAAAVALMFSAVNVASAQGGQGRGQGGGRFGQGRGGMFGGGLQMLRIPQVQTELKMTEAQIAKLDAKQDEVQAGMREIFQSAGGNFRDMTPEDREKLAAKVNDLQNKAVSDVLDAAQFKRYKELVLQREGPLAATRKDVADALKLTDAQRKQIAEIQRGLNEQRMQSFQSLGQGASPEERQKAMGKMMELQTKANDQVLALFTDDQKKLWKDMTGAPFKFPVPGQRAA